VTTAEDADEMTRQDWAQESAAVRDADVTWAMLGYLGAIFTGPVIPLVVYLLRRGKSPFMRYHAARALNLSITVLVYAICCAIVGGLMAADTVTLALIVALTLLFVLWLIMLKYVIRGVIAAHRGEAYEIPGWACATIVKLTRELADHGVREQPPAPGQHQPFPVRRKHRISAQNREPVRDHVRDRRPPRRVQHRQRAAIREAYQQHDLLELTFRVG
jgi:uncharacterized Tic20 family protein